jgi:hypothetical protein
VCVCFVHEQKTGRYSWRVPTLTVLRKCFHVINVQAQAVRRHVGLVTARFFFFLVSVLCDVCCCCCCCCFSVARVVGNIQAICMLVQPTSAGPQYLLQAKWTSKEREKTVRDTKSRFLSLCLNKENRRGFFFANSLVESTTAKGDDDQDVNNSQTACAHVLSPFSIRRGLCINNTKPTKKRPKNNRNNTKKSTEKKSRKWSLNPSLKINHDQKHNRTLQKKRVLHTTLHYTHTSLLTAIPVYCTMVGSFVRDRHLLRDIFAVDVKVLNDRYDWLGLKAQLLNKPAFVRKFELSNCSPVDPSQFVFSYIDSTGNSQASEIGLVVQDEYDLERAIEKGAVLQIYRRAA